MVGSLATWEESSRNHRLFLSPPTASYCGRRGRRLPAHYKKLPKLVAEGLGAASLPSRRAHRIPTLQPWFPRCSRGYCAWPRSTIYAPRWRVSGSGPYLVKKGGVCWGEDCISLVGAGESAPH